MSNDSSPTPATASSQTVSQGRYLYCLVDVSADSDPQLSAPGIADEPVSVVTNGDIAAVVHSTEQLYDTDDMDQIRTWLLSHQRVISAAGEEFGTPLPFQFDVVIEGGDETVTQWMAAQHELIARTLESFDGAWEYRAHMKWDRSQVEQAARETDERLQEIAQQRTQSDEGKQFLLDKQYEERLTEVLHARKSALQEELTETLSAVADEITHHSAKPSVQGLAALDSDTAEWVGRIALLASEDNEDAIGTQLDDLAATPGVEIEFTGPWPPYSFTPEFGQEKE